MDVTVKFKDGSSIIIRVSQMQGDSLLNSVKQHGVPVLIEKTSWSKLSGGTNKAST